MNEAYFKDMNKFPIIGLSFSGNTALCLWQQPQHILFQLANLCFVLSYSAPSSKKGILFMHSVLIIGKKIVILYIHYIFS